MTNSVVHSAACLAAGKAVADWTHAWPHSCATCLGRGTTETGGDVVDYGSTTTTLPVGDEPCADCVGQGKCPRCGSPSLGFVERDGMDEVTSCACCGWQPGADCPATLGYECDCWENATAERFGWRSGAGLTVVPPTQVKEPVAGWVTAIVFGGLDEES